MATLRAILFDIDGTLVDSNDLHVEAWDTVFREAGHAFPRQALHDQIGKGGDNYVPFFLPDESETEQKRLAERHGELFKARYLDRVRPFPAARELLARAHAQGIAVVLASSAGGDELDHYLDLLDARALVDAVTSKDDVDSTKPDPDIFAAALEKAKVAADEALVIGDTPYDAEAATKLGIRAIGLLSGKFEEAALREAGADPIYADAAALLAEWDRSPLAG